MEEEQYRVLQGAFDELCENISDIDGVINYLFAKRAFSKSVMEKIYGNSIRRERVAALLCKLMQTPGVFDKFYDALVAKEEWTAKLLKPGLNRNGKTTDTEAVTTDTGNKAVQKLFQLHDIVLPAKWPDYEVHDANNVKVIKVSDENKSMREHFETAAKSGRDANSLSPYPMQREGKFLLINNFDFSKARKRGFGFKNRPGTEVDQTALEALFKGLGFVVDVENIHNDKEAKEMEAIIREELKKDHSQYDCFACAILTHGSRDAVAGVDGEYLSVNSLIDIVTEESHSSLAGKPKLFFIQACQGRKMDNGVCLCDGPEGAGDGGLSSGMKNLLLDEATPDEQTVGRTEDDGTYSTKGGDIFLAVATISGFRSLRNTVKGSWFIQAVAYIFANYAHLCDITELMLLVNNLVSRARTDSGEKQQPIFNPVSLNRKLYFFPGIPRS